MKKFKRILLIIGVFIMIWSVIFSVDSIRSKEEKNPILYFSVEKAEGEDFSSTEYICLFYKIKHVIYFDNSPIPNKEVILSSW